MLKAALAVNGLNRRTVVRLTFRYRAADRSWGERRRRRPLDRKGRVRALLLLCRPALSSVSAPRCSCAYPASPGTTPPRSCAAGLQRWSRGEALPCRSCSDPAQLLLLYHSAVAPAPPLSRSSNTAGPPLHHSSTAPDTETPAVAPTAVSPSGLPCPHLNALCAASPPLLNRLC